MFDSNGIFVKEFGQYGNGEGEFDCLAGVAVNRIGQYIIADRYNHRIQVLDPSGRFLRAFGTQGTTDGKFNYPWGVTTDALGFIYVCDKENHRVQVSEAGNKRRFVGKSLDIILVFYFSFSFVRFSNQMAVLLVNSVHAEKAKVILSIHIISPFRTQIGSSFPTRTIIASKYSM